MEMRGTIDGLLKERKQEKHNLSNNMLRMKRSTKQQKKPSLKQHPKAYKTLDDDDLSDVEFDGLDYEDAHVAFDPEKSPKLD